MVDLGEIQAAYYMVAATGVLVAAVYYIYNMRVSQKNLKANLDTRQGQLYMQLYQTSLSKDYMDSQYRVSRMNMKTVEDYKRMMNDPTMYRDFFTEGMWHEGAGVLLREGLIDIHTVSLLSSGMIVWWWEHFGEMVLKVRKEFGFPRFMIEAEYLAKRVSEYGLSHPELKIASLGTALSESIEKT
jgi:hypothetical protein